MHSKRYILTEEEIINGCVKQDMKCQKMLFDRYSGKMFAVCLRYTSSVEDAEDVLQEGFVRVFRYLHSFKNQGSLEGWIRRVIVNVALRHFQKCKSRQEIVYQDYHTDLSVVPEILGQLSEQDLLQVINELPEGYRIVFNLYAIEGYSHAEIGKLLEIQESTSRSQLTKARKILYDKIRKIYKIAI